MSDLDKPHVVCRRVYVASANDLHAGFTEHADPEADAEEAAAGARPPSVSL